MSANLEIIDPDGPWTPAEIAWAEDCFRAGDSIADIAATARRPFLDVAMALRVYGYVPRGRRWAAYTKPAPVRFVGAMLCEVVRYRRRRGDSAEYLAKLAGVSPAAIYVVARVKDRCPAGAANG